MTESVNHPAHYGGEDNPYETIKVAEAWGFDQNAYLFNVLKYISRAKGHTLEDLKKARWYLDRLIARLEGKQEAMERHPAYKFPEAPNINTDEAWKTRYNEWSGSGD
jgi:hypothetical protein